MTAIVGVEHPGGVTIGADTLGSNDEVKVSRADPKIFTVGPYLFGFTTSYRMGQLLHYALNPSQPDPRDLDRHMVTTFIDEVRDCLTEGGYASKENSVERGGTFLVAVHGRLYCIEGDYQVGRNRDGYNACGAGEYFALGSLHTTHRYAFTPKQRVLMALDAAAQHSPYVAPPFHTATQRHQ